MSYWLRLTNELKRRPVTEYLTPTQHQVRNDLCELLLFPGWVNLYGASGSGKSFVGRAVVQAIGATHVAIPEQLNDLQPPIDTLVIDNAPSSEFEVRRVLALCNLISAKSVLLVTQRPVLMPIRSRELPLPTPQEISSVLTTFGRFGFYPQQDCRSTSNFWELLLTCV